MERTCDVKLEQEMPVRISRAATPADNFRQRGARGMQPGMMMFILRAGHLGPLTARIDIVNLPTI
jgi:hypothetical protein